MLSSVLSPVQTKTVAPPDEPYAALLARTGCGKRVSRAARRGRASRRTALAGVSHGLPAAHGLRCLV
jgi:hypothetical protein